jgi:hypothetical protein
MRRLKKYSAAPVETATIDTFNMETAIAPLAIRLRRDIGKLPASEVIAYQLPTDVTRSLLLRRLAVSVVGSFTVQPDLILDETEMDTASLHGDFWIDVEAATVNGIC